ncbi:MAG: hypothetical protein M1821_003942 [Bathelium mastoideum]|nr:MAG: hypothetical protein M1821_003942 [Bathelium mastoideum]
MYRYHPLNTTRNEIRLLVLQPGGFSDDIVAYIQHVPLDYKLKYEALSYIWGSPTPGKNIKISGDDFNVRENLYGALRHLRHAEQTRILWIDAICINQSDIHERNQQIKRMREIYNLADEVIVWLGTETPDNRTAVDFLRHCDQFKSIDDRHEEISDMLAKEENAHILNAVSSFLRQEYWSRVWIIQEIRVATQLRVYFGSDSIRWTTFETVVASVGALLEEPGASDGKSSAFASSPKTILREPTPLQISLLRSGFLNISLDAAIFAFWKGRGASDPRDCLYALYGLFDSQVNDNIATPDIDYNLTTKDVFINFVTYGMTNPSTPSEGPLNLICLREPGRTNTELPSWVPDFSARNTSFIELITCQTSPILCDYRSTTTLNLHSSISGDILRSRGFILDIISRCGDYLDDSGAAVKGLRGQAPPAVLPLIHHWEVLQSWTDLALSLSTIPPNDYDSSRNRFKSFWKSIYVDADDAWDFSPDIEPDLWERAFDIAVDFAANRYPTKSLDEHIKKILGDEASAFRISMEVWAMLSRHRRLAVTIEGTFVLAPADVEIHDLVCILLDCDLPVILRRVQDHYIFLGDCYVENIMHGEITGALKRGEYKTIEFDIM